MSGLTLSRRVGEQILVGEILITVQEVCGRTVIVNVDAPDHYDIIYKHLTCDPHDQDRQPGP